MFFHLNHFDKGKYTYWYYYQVTNRVTGEYMYLSVLISHCTLLGDTILQTLALTSGYVCYSSDL